MDIQALIQRADISPKQAALMKYFKVVDLVKKYDNDVDKVMERIDKEGIFSYAELRVLAKKNKTEDLRVWSSKISMLLNLDTIAEKYYYQTISLIYTKRFFENANEQNELIHKCYFQYLSKAFSVVTLNQLFYDLIEIQSPLYLVTISEFEQESINNCCYLFRIEYQMRKDEIIKKARRLIEEVADNVARHEYISERQIDKFLDKSDQVFIKLLG